MRFKKAEKSLQQERKRVILVLEFYCNFSFFATLFNNSSFTLIFIQTFQLEELKQVPGKSEKEIEELQEQLKKLEKDKEKEEEKYKEVMDSLKTETEVNAIQ